MVKGLAQIAGLQVVAAAEDRLVQECEHSLGPLAGRAARPCRNCAGIRPGSRTACSNGAARRRDRCRRRSVRPPAARNRRSGRRGSGRTAAAPTPRAAAKGSPRVREWPPIWPSKPACADLLLKAVFGSSAPSRQPDWASSASTTNPKYPRFRRFFSGRIVACSSEGAEIAGCEMSPASGTSNNHNNSTLRNGNTPWENRTGKRGSSDYGSFYSREEFYESIHIAAKSVLPHAAGQK